MILARSTTDKMPRCAAIVLNAQRASGQAQGERNACLNVPIALEAHGVPHLDSTLRQTARIALGESGVPAKVPGHQQFARDARRAHGAQTWVPSQFLTALAVPQANGATLMLLFRKANVETVLLANGVQPIQPRLKAFVLRAALV